MASHMQSLIYAVHAMRRTLNPPKKLIRMLPDIFLTDTGADFPGCEENNARARRYGEANNIEIKVYQGVGPFSDGIEP